MSVAGISPSSGPTRPVQTHYQQRVADFQQLPQALQAGDLAGAQKAFSALAALTEAGYGSRFSQNSQLAQDFSAVGQALQSGDLAGAQQAFASFRQDVQAARSARGQHQQNRGSANNTNAGSTPEIILNLGNTNNNGSPEQITLDFANGGNGNEQLTTGVSNGSGSSEQVTLNLNNLTATPEIILNLSNPGGASQTQSSGNQLSVTA